MPDTTSFICLSRRRTSQVRARLMLSAFAVALSCCVVVSAQDNAQAQMNDQSTNADTPRARQPGDGARLLAALNLSPEQRAQIAVVRQQAEANRRAATMRLRRARRALDEAIYADAVDDVQINARTREVADAQAAVIRLLADTELRVRRLLTPEQLDTFRALRQRARARQNSNRRFQQQDLNNARPRRLSRQARP